jgi:DNA polymerase-3 subunit gamma/tau
MSYQVLARKWRPKIFREMVGQEHVLQALINALDHDRLHHAYLFTGTRGVGKTSIARILAKCLNCESGISSEPCGQCSSCVEIAEGRSVDLLEVDAASRTKVEDMRDLLDNVQYLPAHSRFKVYLIDEVHMLSGHSFNALLKTLEEPPPHVKFLFATTDPQKLPATILSRCLQFNLKNMPPQQIVGHLEYVLQQEMVSLEEPALWLLARAASGSMRDALSLTDQAIAFGSGKLVESDVRSMLGTVDLSYVYQLLEAVAANEPAKVLSIIDSMAEHAPDFDASVVELISMLHRVTVAQVVPDAIDNSWGDAERIASIANSIAGEDTQLFYQVAINGKRDMSFAADPRSGFEMILLRMIAFRPEATLDESLKPEDVQLISNENTATVAREVDTSVKKSLDGPTSTAIAPPGAAESGMSGSAGQERAQAKPVAVEIKRPPEAAALPGSPGLEDTPNREDIPDLGQLSPDNWHVLLENLGLAGIVYNIASHCVLNSCQDTTVEFVLDENNATLFNDGHRLKISLVLENYFNTSLSVSVCSGQVTQETPAMRKQRLMVERQALAVSEIENDRLLLRLIERFDGKLDRSTIAPLDS